MITTPTAVTIYSDITLSVGTIIARNYIPEVQEKITIMTNNYFVTDLFLQDCVTFNGTALTVVANNSFAEYNFLAGDDIFIYHSYRNDGYFTIASVAGNILTLASGSTIVEELSGRSVLISVVKWPIAIQKAACQMIAYDADVRPKRKGITSRSLGPLSESFGGELDSDGYPVAITGVLEKYKMARLM